jgi:hypothetical protein
MRRILELAQNVHSLPLTRKPGEQAELLKKVLLNCSIDAVSLYPTYGKPFDLICKRAKNEEWLGVPALGIPLSVLAERAGACARPLNGLIYG